MMSSASDTSLADPVPLAKPVNFLRPVVGQEDLYPSSIIHAACMAGSLQMGPPIPPKSPTKTPLCLYCSKCEAPLENSLVLVCPACHFDFAAAAAADIAANGLWMLKCPHPGKGQTDARRAQVDQYGIYVPEPEPKDVDMDDVKE